MRNLQSDSVTRRQRAIFRSLTPMSKAGALIPFGGPGDGQYLVPDDLDGLEALFSPGVADRKSFEDEFVLRLGIQAHLMDASTDVDRLKTPLLEKQTFLKKWLEPERSSNSVSLEEWVQEMAPGKSDLALQMDIEGAEYRNLAKAPRPLLRRFRIIVIELHGLGRLGQQPARFIRENGRAIAALTADHKVVHAHPNNNSRVFSFSTPPYEVPDVVEFTLLRKDRVRNWQGATPSPYETPHIDDLGWNTINRVPIFLNDFWIPEKGLEQSLARRQTILRAWLRAVATDQRRLSAITNLVDEQQRKMEDWRRWNGRSEG